MNLAFANRFRNRFITLCYIKKALAAAFVILSVNVAFANSFSCTYAGSTVGRDPSYIIKKIELRYRYNENLQMYLDKVVLVNGESYLDSIRTYMVSNNPKVGTMIYVDDFLYDQSLHIQFYDPTYNLGIYYQSYYQIGPSEKFMLSCTRLD